MTVRVHAVPLTSGLDAQENRRAAVAAVDRAADDGARLVVLPEYAAAFDPRGVDPEHAEPLDGPFTAALQEAAGRTGVLVVAGMLLPGSVPERAVNAVVAVGGGGVVAVYRKVHLYDAFGHRESDRLEPGAAGDPAVVVTLGGLHLGLMTCYDLRFPESARRLVDAGATVLVVPAAWAAGEHKADHWRTLLRARAIENTSFVVGAAQHGRGVTGTCLVVDPVGVVVGESTSGTAPAVGDVDPGLVAAVRHRNPSLLNRRYDVVPRGTRS